MNYYFFTREGGTEIRLASQTEFQGDLKILNNHDLK